MRLLMTTNNRKTTCSMMATDLRIWMHVKEKVVHHYIHSKDRLDYSLDNLVVNCNDWVDSQ